MKDFIFLESQWAQKTNKNNNKRIPFLKEHLSYEITQANLSINFDTKSAGLAKEGYG